MNRCAALAPILAIWLGACGGILPSADDGVDPSLDREREITEEIATQIRRSGKLVNDPTLLAYLDSLGQELVRASGTQPFVYRFAIIDDDSLNAFTIGGGHVYVHRGVLDQAGDLSELAGVLAHEIAHVTQRHIAKRQEGQGLRTLISLAALAALAAAGADPELLVVADSLNVALELKNSRSAEAEADYVGVGYLISAGIAPRGMVRFFERILAEAPRGRDAVPSYLFTHPAVESRIGTTRGQIARSELPADLRTRDERLPEMQDRLAALRASVAGGSGLLARPAFDREIGDPVLERADQLESSGELEQAASELLRASALASSDPRLPLRLAQLRERQDRLADATSQLEQALRLDPMVPLTQFELGRLYALQRSDARALFYLDMAAAGANPKSSLARRAEAAIRLVVLEPWKSARAFVSPNAGEDPSLEVEFELDPRIRQLGLPLQVRWLGPDSTWSDWETLDGRPTGLLRARHPLGPRPALGTWSVELRLAECRQRRLEVDVNASANEPPSPPRWPERTGSSATRSEPTTRDRGDLSAPALP